MWPILVDQPGLIETITKPLIFSVFITNNCKGTVTFSFYLFITCGKSVRRLSAAYGYWRQLLVPSPVILGCGEAGACCGWKLHCQVLVGLGSRSLELVEETEELEADCQRPFPSLTGLGPAQ